MKRIHTGRSLPKKPRWSHKNGLSTTRHGFTLLEILAATLVIGLLASLALGVYSRSRTSAYRVKCDVHVKAIGLALDAFKQERGYFPEKLDELRTEGYIKDTAVFSCPADPRPNPSYEEYYAIRNPRASLELPILVCPFHETSSQGIQAYVGRYTAQSRTAPARLTAAIGTTVEHPGKSPVAAPVGLELHGADRLRTGSSGSATIEFQDGSYVDIRHNADVTVLQSFLQGEGRLYTLVRQTIGNATYQIRKGSKFDVVTPTTTAGALGTEFEVRVSATEGTWLYVTEGTVRFNTLEGGEVQVIGGINKWYAAPLPPVGPPPPPGQRPKPGPGVGSPPPP